MGYGVVHVFVGLFLVNTEHLVLNGSLFSVETPMPILKAYFSVCIISCV
jgi:hypothetical protein